MWAGFIYVFDYVCMDHLVLLGLMHMSYWFQTQHGVGAGKQLAMLTTALATNSIGSDMSHGHHNTMTPWMCWHRPTRMHVPHNPHPVSYIIMVSILHFKCIQLIALGSRHPLALNSPAHINPDSFLSRSIIITIITFIDHGTPEYISYHFIPIIFIKLYWWLPQATIVSLDTTIKEQLQSFNEQSPSAIKFLSANASLWNWSSIHPYWPSLPLTISTKTTPSFGRRHFEDGSRDTIHRNHGMRTDICICFIMSRYHISALLTTLPTGWYH